METNWREVYTQLRPYQQEAVDTFIRYKKFLNFDDMGIGKTVVTLTTMFACAEEYQLFALIIFCPKKALYVWKEELLKWFGIEGIIYAGTPTQRKKLDNSIKRANNPVVITTYGVGTELLRLPWSGIICDEIHEAGLLNHTTQTYNTFKKPAAKVSLLGLLTGTPVRKGCIDQFAPLSLVDPNKFSNYWPFVNKWCNVIETPFGKSIERKPRDIATYRTMLNEYMVRRLKTEVAKDLPGKQRSIIPLDMTPLQMKAHTDLMVDLMHVTEDEILIVAPNVMTAIMRARQLLVTPRLLGINEDGAALEYLCDEGADLVEAGRPFVVFTPFKQALPFIAEALRKRISNLQIFELSGGLTPAKFADSWQGFQEAKTHKKVLICVIKSGASFHATTASDCFFLGYEWDFNLNVQSEDRLCRIGQNNSVNCYYVLHNGTVDEAVKDKLNDKQLAADWILSPENVYQKMLETMKGEGRK